MHSNQTIQRIDERIAYYRDLNDQLKAATNGQNYLTQREYALKISELEWCKREIRAATTASVGRHERMEAALKGMLWVWTGIQAGNRTDAAWYDERDAKIAAARAALAAAGDGGAKEQRKRDAIEREWGAVRSGERDKAQDE